MSLTNELGRIRNELQARDVEYARLEDENKSLRTSNAKQAGALEESRAQNRELILRNEKLAAQIARINKHLRDSLGSAEHIIKAAAELEPKLPGVPAKPEVPNSILGKLTRLSLKTEAAA